MLARRMRDDAAESRAHPTLRVRSRAARAVSRSPVLRAPRRAALRSLAVTWATPWPVLARRTQLPEMLSRRGLLDCGVEVGVKEGVFSEILLERWPGRRLILVDPWSAAPP
jgi:hypothetical protein